VSLTLRDAENLREQLEAALRQAGIEWVIQQAYERISLGKTVQKDIDTSMVLREFGEVSRKPSRRQMSEFLASEPFDAIEQLEILLEAIRAGLISPAKMESCLFENLGEKISEIKFFSDEGATAEVRRHDEGATVDVQGVEKVLRAIKSLAG